MNTYLGISAELGSDDVSEDVAGEADILFLEGYLYDKDKGKAAFQAAAKACRATGGKAGIALSDPFCVDRHRADFRQLVKDLDYDVVDIDLIVVRKKEFLKKIPYFYKFFINSVHAVLSKTEPSPERENAGTTEADSPMPV